MTYVTEILADESGVQYQGVKDKTGGTGTYPITGLITGKFLRGRFDKPMTITNANIRAMLGYDPKNPCYVAVQDALNSGVPSVRVLRVENGPAFCQIGPKYNCYFIINLLESETGNKAELLNKIVNEATVSISGQKLVKTDDQGSKGYYRIENIDDSFVRITVEGYGDVELRDYDVVICTPVQVTIEPEYQ